MQCSFIGRLYIDGLAFFLRHYVSKRIDYDPIYRLFLFNHANRLERQMGHVRPTVLPPKTDYGKVYVLGMNELCSHYFLEYFQIFWILFHSSER